MATALGPALAPAGETPQEADILKAIVTRIRHWEDGVGKDFHRKNERFYRQYRGFSKWHQGWVQAGPNDRDGWVPEAKKEWGADLHIPLSFRTIESVIPRAIANAPKLLYLPRDEQWRENVEYVQMMIDAQQEQIDIDLEFQGVMRSGQTYGLGVGKTWWDKKTRQVQRMMPRTLPGAPEGPDTHYLGTEDKVIFDDPRFAEIDVFGFMWDAYGYDMNSVDWTAQQMWMSVEQIIARLSEASWDSPAAQLLTEDDVRKLPSQEGKYSEIWAHRMEESGFNVGTYAQQGEHIHEVIEYHDGENVYTVLDRKIMVKTCANPCGEMPFQIYRPTPLSKQMVGIGALEPLEHLQRELDTLRSQRRDLVTLALCAGYAYDSGVLDASDLEFGPASAIAVDGDPRQALMPLTVRDVPGAGYQEEQSIRTDIEAVSGESDALDNSPAGTSSTATEAQLVQAALGRRIELGARRFEIECVRRCARQFLYLDQREISGYRSLVQPGTEPEPLNPEAARYKWFKIGPGELEGEYEIVVEGGSMAARNVPQDRADAAQMLNSFGHDPFMDWTKVRLEALRLMGVKHPSSFLKGEPQTVPQAILPFLTQLGVDPAITTRALLAARRQEAVPQGGAGATVTAGSAVVQQGAH